MSLRVCSTVLAGLNASSYEMNLILRPPIPPSSFTFGKYPSMVWPTTAKGELGPLYDIVWPTLISLSLGPGPYFVSAVQPGVDRIASVRAIGAVTPNVIRAAKCIYLNPPGRINCRRGYRTNGAAALFGQPLPSSDLSRDRTGLSNRLAPRTFRPRRRPDLRPVRLRCTISVRKKTFVNKERLL